MSPSSLLVKKVAFCLLIRTTFSTTSEEFPAGNYTLSETKEVEEGKVAVRERLPKEKVEFHTSIAECHPIFSFDTIGPYRQEEAKSRAKERIYYYRETDLNEEDSSILTKDELGLVCFTKMINCTVPSTASTASSRKVPNCVYFSKEFCTRKYTQMKWKGSVCPIFTETLHSTDYQCSLRALGGHGGVEVSGSLLNGKQNKSLYCKNSDALCLALKPPFHTRIGSSDRNPPTGYFCLCPLGYTGTDCAQLDIDLFHLDLLHNVDLRNILLKYQQKDRYFIGVTLLFLLIVTLFSVLAVVAGCSFLTLRLPSILPESFKKAAFFSSSSSDGIKGQTSGRPRERTTTLTFLNVPQMFRHLRCSHLWTLEEEEGEGEEQAQGQGSRDMELEMRFYRARMERRRREERWRSLRRNREEEEERRRGVVVAV